MLIKESEVVDQEGISISYASGVEHIGGAMADIMSKLQ